LNLNWFTQILFNNLEILPQWRLNKVLNEF